MNSRSVRDTVSKKQSGQQSRRNSQHCLRTSCRTHEHTHGVLHLSAIVVVQGSRHNIYLSFSDHQEPLSSMFVNGEVGVYSIWSEYRKIESQAKVFQLAISSCMPSVVWSEHFKPRKRKGFGWQSLAISQHTFCFLPRPLHFTIVHGAASSKTFLSGSLNKFNKLWIIKGEGRENWVWQDHFSVIPSEFWRLEMAREWERTWSL